MAAHTLTKRERLCSLKLANQALQRSRQPLHGSLPCTSSVDGERTRGTRATSTDTGQCLETSFQTRG